MNKKKYSERKTERIVLMVSSKDKAQILKNASKNKVTASEYLRQVGIRGAIEFKDMTPWLERIDLLNEIIRTIKQSGDSELVQKIADLVKEEDERI